MVAVGEEEATTRTGSEVDRFEEVFRRSYGRLYGLAYRLLGDRWEAEDLLQNVFIKLSTDPVLRRPDHEVFAWLRRACLNAGYNALRSERRAAEHLDRAGRLGALVVSDSETGPLLHVLREEQQRHVRAALVALPERQRACLLLRHSGHSYAEIAASLDLAIGSVGVLLVRAEAAFRASYQNEESP